MKPFIYILTFLYVFTVLSAQNTTNLNRLIATDWSSLLRGNQPMMTKKRENIELCDTPFVFDEWQKGAVIVSDSFF